MNINETYTGADATLEILLMLFISFLLGALLMWIYDRYLAPWMDGEDFEDDEELEEISAMEIIDEDDVEEEDFNDNETVEVVRMVSPEDDLKIIEGVGPKIESILKSAGLKTLEDISNTAVEDIRSILKKIGGERYAFHDPSTWPDQARLAFEGRQDELKEYQEFLNGGKL